MCQHWAGYEPMLAASAHIRPSAGILTGLGEHIVGVCFILAQADD